MNNPLYRPAQFFILLFLMTMASITMADNLCAIGGTGGTGNTASTKDCPSPARQVEVRAEKIREGGIGGTGDLAVVPILSDGIGGTGIVGIITEFGSIWVNGIRVQYNENTPVQDNGATLSTAQLALGQVVAVEAVEANGSTQAQRISVLHEVIGPVGKIDLAQNKMTVLGQTVRVTAETHHMTLENIKVGDAVQVSGLRDTRGVIVASHIAPAAQGAIEVRGRVAQITVDGFQIFDLPVSATPPTELTAGREVRVTGTWDGQRLLSTQIKIEPAIPFNGKLERLSLQGYVSTSNNDNRLLLGGIEIDVPQEADILNVDGANMAAADLNDQRVTVRVRVDADRRMVAERIKVERDQTEREHKNIINKGARKDAKPRQGRGNRTDNSGRRNKQDDDARKRDRPERPDRSGRAERPERPERPEKIEQPED